MERGSEKEDEEENGSKTELIAQSHSYVPAAATGNDCLLGRKAERHIQSRGFAFVSLSQRRDRGAAFVGLVCFTAACRNGGGNNASGTPTANACNGQWSHTETC